MAVGLVVFSMSINKPTSSVSSPESAVMPTVITKQDPVTSPSIVTSPQDGKEAGFTIQVYSFQDQQRAAKALESLKASGYKAFQEVSDLGEKGVFYRVRIGGIKDEAQAQSTLLEIRKNYQSGFIVKPLK